MTIERDSPAAPVPAEQPGQTPSLVADDASLIVTFYGPRDREQALIARLTSGLSLRAHSRNMWADDAEEAILSRFDPPAAHDTTVIQLALNVPGAADLAWQAMRERLESLLANDTALRPMWGYTLIYQAVLAEGITPEAALGELLHAARHPHAPPGESPHVLAADDVMDGKLWLLEIPTWGDGVAATTVYLALGPEDPQNRLVQDVLYGPGASLLMPDLIAHKGYHQMRQYRLGDVKGQYERKIEAMVKGAGRLLHDLRQEQDAAGELDELARDYGRVLAVTTDLERLRISLERQLSNYSWWQAQRADSEILQFHRSHLQTAVLELQLLLAEGQGALEAAGTAVNILQAYIDKQRERRQQGVQTLLAVAGTALAVLQLVDRGAAAALLQLFGVDVPPDGEGVLLLLGVQLGITVLFAAAIGLLVNLWGAKRRKSVASMPRHPPER